MPQIRDSVVKGKFLCQNCTNPIEIRSDFEEYGNSTLSSMIGFEVKSQISSSADPKIVQTIKVKNNLSDLLNGRVETKGPICEECADILINTQLKLIAYQKRCIDNLEKFLEHLKAHSDIEFPSEGLHTNKPSNEMYMILGLLKDGETLQTQEQERSDHDSAPQSAEESEVDKMTTKSRLAQLRDELIAAQEKRAQLQRENQQLDEDIANASSELSQREEDLARLKMEYNELRVKVMEGEEKLNMLEARFTDGHQQYKRLRHTNVLNATFPIWYDGHIGVINSLHLGRLPSNPISWAEINAALGQCAMLATCLAKKFSYTFKNYVITPIGNQSRIAALPNGSPMPLYNASGAIRLLGNNSSGFDTALVMYLDCIGQLQALVERPPDFCLPYKIMENGRIQDRSGLLHSIKYSDNTDENWTRTLKMLLIDLKYIIASTLRNST
nr:beclin 1 [Hymenolepis microstoma]